jgi:UDP:flavonoid glycosyltransferase YjiC (YdhE family)
MPMGRDQHGNAQRVEHLGVGKVLSQEAEPSVIADTVTAILHDPDMVRRAADVRSSYTVEIARDDAIAEIEALVRTR